MSRRADTSRPIGVRTMRRVDATIGRPLCALVSGLLRLRPQRRRPAEVRSILLVKLAEQGATVAAHAAIRSAVQRVGREHVYVAVFAENRFVLDELGAVPAENVLTIRTTSLPTLVRDARAVVRRCHQLGIDAAVDLEFFSRSSALVTALSGASVRVGLHAFHGHGPRRGNLMTHRVSANPTQHVAHTFRALVEAIDQPPDQLPALALGPWPLEPPPHITPTDDERQQVRRIVAEVAGDDVGPIVLLNPNSGDLVPLRRWPTERYIELARRLLDDRPEATILLTGSPAEAADVEQVARAVDRPRCATIAGRTTMRQLLVLYGMAEVLVTNDSGPAHYATLTPIDVVVLFGPETPQVFGPISPRSHHVWAGSACSPCVNAYNNRLSPCTNNLCMQRITTDDVLARVLSLLDQRAAATG